MSMRGRLRLRIALPAWVTLCGLAIFLNAAAERAQQPTSPPAPQSTNLGTLVVAPQSVPGPATAAKKPLNIQRSSLNLNIQPTLPPGMSQQGGAGAQSSSASLTPPRPLQMAAPRYPPAAYRQNARGTVTVTFVVTPEGKTDQIRILEAEPPRLFNAAARTAVRNWRFIPAMRNGRPVPMTVTHTLHFAPPATANSPPPAQRPTPGMPSNLHPLVIVPPRYPPGAYQRHQRGSVTVQFRVMPDGHTADIRVLAATPRGVFDTATIAAVRQWHFQPVATPTLVVQTIQFKPPND